MIVFAFPAIIAGTALLELERAFDWPFFIAARGGDPLLWQHLFWFFGHPEVYIIFLPAAGMVSMMVPTLARTPLVGYRAIVVALVAVGFFSFALWAHHMFTAGLGHLSQSSLVSAASLAVAVPSGMQVFAWIATLWRGPAAHRRGASLFLLGFLFIFVLGGLTGVMVAVLPFDWQVHDTYFVVAHLHYVLIGGMVFPLFAALYHWTPLVNGHAAERAARALGVRADVRRLQPRVLSDAHQRAARHAAARLHLRRRSRLELVERCCRRSARWCSPPASCCSSSTRSRTWRRPRARPRANPWQRRRSNGCRASSYGTRSIPQVDARDPLWARPALADEVAAGAALAAGHRDRPARDAGHEPAQRAAAPPDRAARRQLVAAARRGRHRRLLPAADGEADMCRRFALGIVAIAAIVVWLWQTDRQPHRRSKSRWPTA